MSSDVQVKDEPVSENEFNAETDSEAEDDIDLDKLQPLDPKFAAFTKFPIGCKVWYDLCKSTKPTKCLQAKSAYVEEAYIHFENRKQVYKVKSSETTEDEATLYEDRLIYGANCPVTVTCHDTNEVRNGVIICPKLDKGKDGDGKQRISYAVQFWQGKKVSIEFGVAAEGVKYRMEAKASIDENRKGCGIVAAKGSAENESCNINKEDGIDELTTNKAGEIQSTEVHLLPAGKMIEEEKGEVVEVESKMLEDNVSSANEMREHENPPVTEANERPKKVARTTSNERECICVLSIPSWFKDKIGLFGYVIGADGHKTRHIKYTTNCSVWVSRDDDDDMTIKITSWSNYDITQTSRNSNVAKAVELIEESIVEFLADRDTEKKFLYELALKARVSNYDLFPRESGFVLRKYDGVRKWCRVLDLPNNWGKGGDDPDKWLQDLKTLQWLQDLKTLQSNDCIIELFDDISRTAPYVFIAASRKKEVQEISTEVFNAMRFRQRNATADCRSKH